MEEDRSLVINSIIGQGTSYSGDIESIDLLRIDGNFHGTAKSHDVILIGENGKVKGTLIAPRVVIAGIFQGEIAKCQLVILQSTAVIFGSLYVSNIIIESGALICGALATAKSLEVESLSATLSEDEETDEDIITRNVGKYSTKMLERLFSS